jgi:hypothetical protein
MVTVLGRLTASPFVNIRHKKLRSGQYSYAWPKKFFALGRHPVPLHYTSYPVRSVRAEIRGKDITRRTGCQRRTR